MLHYNDTWIFGSPHHARTGGWGKHEKIKFQNSEPMGLARKKWRRKIERKIRIRGFWAEHSAPHPELLRPKCNSEIQFLDLKKVRAFSIKAH